MEVPDEGADGAGGLKKHRASWLTVREQYNLNTACRSLTCFGFGTYLVGSVMHRRDYHDVDLRCILEDGEYDKMFGTDEKAAEKRLHFLNAAVSEWLAARTGLPIDFQFQRQTEANAKFPGPRSFMGY